MGSGVGSSNADDWLAEGNADATGYGSGTALGRGNADGTNHDDSSSRAYASGSGHGFRDASGVGAGSSWPLIAMSKQ